MEKRVTFKGWLLPLILLTPQIIVSAVFFFYPAGQAVWQSLFIPDPFGLRWFAGSEYDATLVSSPAERTWESNPRPARVSAAVMQPR